MSALPHEFIKPVKVSLPQRLVVNTKLIASIFSVVFFVLTHSLILTYIGKRENYKTLHYTGAGYYFVKIFIMQIVQFQRENAVSFKKNFSNWFQVIKKINEPHKDMTSVSTKPNELKT